MRASRKRKWIATAAVLGTLVVLIPMAAWRSLKYEPPFYRKLAGMDRKIRRVEADRFVTQTFQLRNDIANEDHWEASFTDEEFNAWLAEDLVTHFADFLPDGVRDPLVVFELDRVTLAFRLERGPFTSLVWAVARVQVADDNTVALTLEKIRAGAVPVSPEEVVAPIIRQARAYGLDVDWKYVDDEPVALIRYSPTPARGDVVLERVVLFDGRLYLSGRSDREAGQVTGVTLPSRRVLQMNFPIRSRQPHRLSPPTRTSSTSPMT
ncbi:hypothetical protein [Tautonia plasticadhaerens]|uniref:Uncharacterized protein n=1 Tax=Tautonia plasticadhaerens TaxID=2527974 RepID=A0A518GXJ8_9BACT|nr:hypothetical protein [Tautonia plasticadhaerens]QDV33317.1 hypothetical protein ElP_11880 [Tautonia plasticadhaerens]